MTLNQLIKRLRGISLAHKQVRNFYFGVPTNFLTEKTTRYPSVFLQDTSGSLDLTGKERTLSFRLFGLDLVHVSEDAKENELDVQSDMLSVIEDIVAESNHSSYTDWKVSISNPIQLVKEEFDDMVAGAVIDISIVTPYEQDICVVPTDELPLQYNPDDMKYVYDEKYIADGTEGTALNIPAIVGKKVLFITRESSPIYKVSSSPTASEYTWDNTTVTLGAAASSNERFLILYRNY